MSVEEVVNSGGDGERIIAVLLRCSRYDWFNNGTATRHKAGEECTVLLYRISCSGGVGEARKSGG